MKYFRKVEIASVTGTNTLFLKLPRPCILRVVNLNNQSRGYTIAVMIELCYNDNVADTSTIALVHKEPMLPDRDVHWEGNIDIKKPDDPQFIRAAFDNCEIGDILNLTIGVEQ